MPPAAVPTGGQNRSTPATLRQDERHLSRSMRRLTGLMAVVSLAAAVVVFLLFPRGAGQAMLVPLQLQPQDGPDRVHRRGPVRPVARITQNDNVVAYAEVWKHEGNGAETKLVSRRMPLLCGASRWTPTTPTAPKGEWKRNASDEPADAQQAESTLAARPARRQPAPDGYWRQKIRCKPTGTPALFALAGAFQLTPHRELRLRHGDDGALQSDEPINAQTDYEVLSTGEPGQLPRRRRCRSPIRRPGHRGLRPAARRERQRRRAGPLARAAVPPTPALGQPDWMRRSPRTLRATSAAPTSPTRWTSPTPRPGTNMDPYVWFLRPDGHRGHCEYFAGAMVLMCQSLGHGRPHGRRVQVRRVQHTPGAGYYIVRQSQAHAWVEVRTAEGWKTFDPTSGRDDRERRSPAGSPGGGRASATSSTSWNTPTPRRSSPTTTRTART